MPTPALPDDVLLEAVKLRSEHTTVAAAAAAAGLPWNTFAGRLRRAAERGMMLDAQPAMPGYRISQVTTAPGGKQTIQQRPEHGEVFEVPPGMALKGVTALVDPEGRVVHKHVMARADNGAANTLAILRTAVDELKQELPRVAPSKGPEQSNELLLSQYTLTDLHFGMLAWAEETRNADYDLKIAEAMLLDWFSAAVAMSPHSKVGVLAQLGDLMHHDALESVTPAHRHVLDADSRLQKMVRVVIRVIRRVIDMMLQHHRQVHIVMASANHDPASSAWLRELLHAMYEDEPRISVDNSPDVYYAYEWGKTALFYHHGHKRKVGDVDTVFAGKFRELFGRAEHCYGHVGHLHSDEVVESNLMRVERHRTLAPPDAYASSGGWLSKRDAKVITYHREFGEVSRITLSPKMVAGARLRPSRLAAAA